VTAFVRIALFGHERLCVVDPKTQRRPLRSWDPRCSSPAIPARPRLAACMSTVRRQRVVALTGPDKLWALIEPLICPAWPYATNLTPASIVPRALAAVLTCYNKPVQAPSRLFRRAGVGEVQIRLRRPLIRWV